MFSGGIEREYCNNGLISLSQAFYRNVVLKNYPKGETKCLRRSQKRLITEHPSN